MRNLSEIHNRDELEFEVLAEAYRRARDRGIDPDRMHDDAKLVFEAGVATGVAITAELIRDSKR